MGRLHVAYLNKVRIFCLLRLDFSHQPSPNRKDSVQKIKRKLLEWAVAKKIGHLYGESTLTKY